MSDREIVRQVISAHETDIQTGKLAETKAISHEIKQFATFMMADYTTMKKATQDFALKMKVGIDEKLVSDAVNKIKSLKVMSSRRPTLKMKSIFTRKSFIRLIMI